MHEIVSAAGDFIGAIDTDSNSVDEIEVVLRRVSLEQGKTILIALNDFLMREAGGERVSVKVVRDLPNFRVKLSLRATRADDHIVVPELTAKTGRVDISTTAGVIEYEPPIDVLEDSYTSSELGTILTYGKVPNRMTAQRLRNKSELIGLPIGNQFYHPKFQIAVSKKRVVDIVAYTNQMLWVNEDPWGSLSWWFTGSELYSGRSPHDLLVENLLDEATVKTLIEADRVGMG